MRTYWRLTEIEATFRSLKTELGLRPIWHVKHSRIAAHLFLAVLAYHGVHLIRTRLKARDIPCRGRDPHPATALVRMTTTIRETNGRLIVNRQDVRPPAQVAQIARAVGVEPYHHAGAPAGNRAQTHKRSASLLAPGFVTAVLPLAYGYRTSRFGEVG